MTTSHLRTELRHRLRRALRERDRPVVAAMRSTIAALENAEAVPTADAPITMSSSHVAGAAIGLGATEAARRVLDEETESAIVQAEVDGLHEAARAYDLAGPAERAEEARTAAAELMGVVHSVCGQHGDNHG